MSTLPPAGWYPDPDNAAQMRWWDGEHWTEARATAPIATSGGLRRPPLPLVVLGQDVGD